MNKCRFCTLAKSNQETIWQNKYFFAILDGHPVSPGHTLLIPKSHVVNLTDLDDQTFLSLKVSTKNVISFLINFDLESAYQKMIQQQISKKSVNFCKKTVNSKNINKKPDAYNFGVNEGKAAGRTVDHLHWHIIPRFIGDVDNPVGGVRYVIPELGNYK